MARVVCVGFARLGGPDDTPNRLASGVSGRWRELLKVVLRARLGGLDELPTDWRRGFLAMWRDPRRKSAGSVIHESKPTQKHETQPTRETPDASRLGASSTKSKPTQKHETQPTRETPDASRPGASSTNPSQRRNTKHNPPARPPTQVGRERHPQIQANAETRNTTHPRDPRRKSAGSVIHQSKPTQKHETQPTRETPDASRLGASSIPPNQNSGRLNIAIDSDRNFDSSFK